MMQKISFYTLLIGLIVLSACHTAKKLTGDRASNEKDTAVTDIKWQLTELYGKAVPDSINGKVPYFQLSEKDGRYTGTAGCNGIGGEFKLTGNGQIQFSRGMSTMMACKDMEVEKGFNKVLNVADHYERNGSTLILYQDKAVILAKFAMVGDEQRTASLDGKWELNYISGPRITFAGLYPDKKPTIEFNTADLKAYGNSSCNNYNVTFTLSNNTIEFSDPTSTRMACQGAGEPTYFKTLKMVDQFRMEDSNTLTLLKGDVALMRFVRH